MAVVMLASILTVSVGQVEAAQATLAQQPSELVTALPQATGGPACALEGAGGWQFRAHVSPNDGLVLDQSSFKGRVFTEQVSSTDQVSEPQVSVPYLEGIYRYGKAAGLVSKIELTPTRDQAHASLPGQPIVGSTLDPGSFKCEAIGTDIHVKAEYVVDDFVAERASPGPLTVTQEYRFRGVDKDHPCEPSNTLRCGRFWPSLSYRYAGDPACNPDRSPTCGKFTALRTVQRLAFRPDGVLNGAIDAYFDSFDVTDAFRDPGIIDTKGSGGSMKYEGVDQAISNGERKHWDSIHQSPTGATSGPGVFSPGCGECVHMHWAWGWVIAKRYPGWTDGKPQIREGSRQSADFGVARLVDTDAERDPVVNGWRSLIDKEKSEASKLRGYTPVIFWEMTSFDKEDATFPLLDNDLKRDGHYKHGGNGAIFFGEYSPYPALPRAPANLRSTGRTASSITLAWDPSDRASGYRVYKNDVLTRQLSTTNTTIGGLRDNTTYKFTVSAFNAAGESAPSNAITVQTLPTWKFKFVSQQVHDEVGADLDLGHVRPGERGRVVIKVRNTGSATWTRDGPNPVLLGIWPERPEPSPLEQDWFRPNRPAQLSEAEVKQGHTGTFEFWIKAPSEGLVGPGEERFNLVAEGLTWFDDRGLRIRFNVIPVVGMAATPDGGGYWLVAADGGVFSYGNAKFHGSAANVHLNAPVVGMAATPDSGGYWLVAADGGVFSYGNARFHGSAADVRLQKPVVGMAANPDGGGYWLVAADGGVFSYGNAKFHGSMGGKPLNQPVVGMAATPDGGGYWLVAADGGVFAFGNAEFHGSAASQQLQKSMVGMAATPDGDGYWLVAADGGVFAYGNAKFHGSAAQLRLRAPVTAIAAHPKASGYWLLTAGGDVLPYGKAGFWGSLGLRFKKPVVGITATPDGSGYWLAAADGGVFSYGNTRFHGSAADLRLRRPVVGMAATPDGGGYWLVAADGGVFSYGNAQFHGSAADIRLQKPVVGMAATPDGGGYWLVAADGGVFTYGNARFHGSAADVRLQKPVVGMAATPDGGYWLVAADGGVFTYGNAKFYGSAAEVRLNKPVVGMAATLDGGGYWLVAADGGVFAYGNAKFYGSAANDRLRRPVIGMAAHPQGNGYWLAASDGTVRHFIAEESPTGAIPKPNPTDWQLNGAAQLNDDDLVLTPAENDIAGTAFYKTPIKADGLHASFTALMEGGSGADGLTLAFLDPASATTSDVGGTGGLLGFAGLAGTAVALDTWSNLNDPSENFVGVAQSTKTTGYNDEGPIWLATTTEVPRLIGSPHQVEVTYTGGHLTVRIDANQVLDTVVELPSNVLVGFTGATGDSTNVHTVRDVTITPGERESPPQVA